MKLTFLGVGSPFSSQQLYHSNMLLTAESGCRMLIDCGSDIRFSLGEHGMSAEKLLARIDAIYVSHLHADHIGGLEWVAFNCYFGPARLRPKLFAEENLLQRLWDHGLRAGLESVQGKCMTLDDYFDCRPVPEGGSFQWEGMGFKLIKMPHIMSGCRDHSSYGLFIEQERTAIFITTDTQFQPEIVTEMAVKTEAIFHDCETSPVRTTVHAHYDELLTLPDQVKRKIWLYHYQSDSGRDAERDGFRGFVRKGQEFDFPA
jgi:ribonuclease BN (tRNA processing enzyme)